MRRVGKEVGSGKGVDSAQLYLRLENSGMDEVKMRILKIMQSWVDSQQTRGSADWNVMDAARIWTGL